MEKLLLINYALVVIAVAYQTTLQAPLRSPRDRSPAADFALTDASGKTATLVDYRGKVVLLDFWATWCHGCKEEIPWFSAMQQDYADKGFAVVGVSMDDGGWKVLKPFLAENHVPYRIFLGDDAIARRYGIGNLPDTFLIDRHGRVAAAYISGLVDRQNIEANVKSLLSER